jgi:hypothetical protein
MQPFRGFFAVLASWREALSPFKLFKPFKTAELSVAIERSDAIEQLERLEL